MIGDESPKASVHGHFRISGDKFIFLDLPKDFF